MRGFIRQAEEVAGGHPPLPLLLAQDKGQRGVERGPPRSRVEAHFRPDESALCGLDRHRQFLNLSKAAGGPERPIAHLEDKLFLRNTLSSHGIRPFPKRLEAFARPEGDSLSKGHLHRLGLGDLQLSMNSLYAPGEDPNQGRDAHKRAEREGAPASEFTTR